MCTPCLRARYRGLFIGGGLAPKHRARIESKDSRFMQAPHPCPVAVKQQFHHACSHTRARARVRTHVHCRARSPTPSRLAPQAFADKGRMRALVSRIPLRLVLAEDIGERGAQLLAIEAVRRTYTRQAREAAASLAAAHADL